jgi:biotin carboxyl carrier protein
MGEFVNSSLRVGKILWLHKDGRTFFLDLEERSQSTKAGVAGAISGAIKSPMPGKILKIESTVGQKVKAGQTLCVIEAMKMEYALKAPFEGKIKEIFKSSGDQVLLNEKIILLEEL